MMDVRHIRHRPESSRIGRRLSILVFVAILAGLAGIWIGMMIGAAAYREQAAAERREIERCRNNDALAFMELETRSVICWGGSNRLSKRGLK